MVCCEVCDNLQEDCYEPNDRYLRHKEYTPSLQRVKTQGEAGCPFCALLYDAVKLFQYRWAAFQERDLYLRWTSFHRTDTERWLLRLDSVRRTRENSQWGPLWERPYICQIEVHSKPGTRSSWQALKCVEPISGRSDSHEALERVESWLQECVSKHKKCQVPEVPQLPTRVIDVGSATGYEVPFLYESQRTHGLYATLSHCWGSAMPVKTTRTSLESRKRGIPWDELPKTFQDAVTISRRLGIRYLWIDSLCIIQDDEQDWNHECSQMASIYQNSWLTIAATGASDSSQGCFSSRASSKELVGAKYGLPYTWYVREPIDHHQFLQIVVAKPRDGKFPLFQRAWCVQERFLARRLLHYTEDELVWQCRSSDRCECLGITGSAKAKFHNASRVASDAQLRDIWNDMVREYAQSALSRESDILPAISSLASTFQNLKHNFRGQYLAGIWEGTLPTALLWASLVPGRRPSLYTAPTFSWASRIGPLHMGRTGLGAHDSRRCEFITGHCDASPMAPYGVVTGGFVKLCGPLFPVELSQVDGSFRVRRQGRDIEKQEVFIDTEEDALESSNAVVFCAPVKTYFCNGSDGSVYIFYAILLRPHKDDTYRRIGIVQGCWPRGSYVSDEPKREFIIK